MTETFECGDNPALVGFMYGECEPGEKRAIESHVAICPACTAELEALGATRLQLAAWTPPEVDLGFHVVRAPAAAPGAQSPKPRAESPEPGPESPEPVAEVLRPGPWWSHPMPAWAQMAAAAAIFAAGLSLGVLRGTVSTGGAVSAGEAVSTEQATAGQATASVTAAASVSAGDLAALEQRLRDQWRDEMSRMRVSAPASAQIQTAGQQGASEAQLLARVRALIDESEQRQQRVLALRTAQVVREIDSQRRVDLQNVRSVIGEMEGTTGAEIARQQQTLQYLMRVSQQR